VIAREELRIETDGRRAYDLSIRVQRVVAESAIETGMCHVFICHTSASLMLCENADPAVLRDLEAFMSR